VKYETPHFHYAEVESAVFLNGVDPPRWAGRLLLPDGRRSMAILIFDLQGEFRALPALCPHEGHDLTLCPSLDGNTFICPAHGLRIDLNASGFRVVGADGNRFLVPLSEIGSPGIAAHRSEDPSGREDSGTIRRLREEVEKLRLANLKQEKQILAITRSMDSMLSESEQQKANLKETIRREQALSCFIHRVLDTMDDLLLVIDTEGRIRRLNTAVGRQLDLSEEELLGSAVDDLLAPAERQHLAGRLPPLPWRVHSILLETVRLGGTYSGEHTLLGKNQDGSRPIYWLKAALLHSKQGKLEGAVVTASNITELKNRETRLRLSAKVFGNSSEAIFITDPKGTILEVNTAFCRITGYERSEVIGRNTRMLKSGLHDQAFYESLWTTLLSRGFWKGEIWDRRKNGELCPMLLSINAVADEQGRLTHYVAIAADISRQKQTEQELERLAYYDTLTGLPNRFLFKIRFEHETLLAERHGAKFAVLFIDLDHFKNVNDMLGHWAGDSLLKIVAERIQSCLRKTDTVARLGGDEFTVILPGLNHAAEASEIARKLVDTVAKPVRVNNHRVYVGASIGIALFPEDGRDFTTLTRHADVAMYASKAKGRGTFQYFEARMNEAAHQRILLETQLRLAIEREEFMLHYQPKLDCASNRVTGAEALIRWRRPDGGIVPPDRFIPVAEETALILPLGKWILRTACLQARKWTARLPGFRVAINLSARQLLSDDFIDALDLILAESGTDAGSIELEITESMVMHDVEKATERLRRIRERGIHVAMDDFGSGHSSLSHLQKLPIQTLKIDRSFIQAYGSDPASEPAALIKTIVTLGQIFNLKIVAEGVETESQLELLKSYGCHEIQGHYLSPPLPADEFQRCWIEQPPAGTSSIPASGQGYT
jgi:diguanylate cyclase (GGDEF)-like protein/PAS domain S-box-containing protein